MSTPDNGRRQAKRIIWAQLVVTAVIAGAFAVFSGGGEAAAALAGGLINVIANLVFARRLYGGRAVKSATESISRFYVGEVVKLFMTVALLALALGALKLAFVPLFTTFVATLLVFWLALSPMFDRLFSNRWGDRA